MRKRTNHPLKSLMLFAVIGVLAYLAWEFIHVRRVLSVDVDEVVPQEVLKRVRRTLVDNFDANPCIVTIGDPSYRPRSNHYRVNVTLVDGCEDQAKSICKDIAAIVGDLVDGSVGVFAWDMGGTLVVKYLD